MRWGTFFAVLLLSWSVSAQDQQATDEASVSSFIDGFFTEFAALNPVLEKDEQKSATSLTAYVVSNFTKVSEDNRRKGRIPPVDLVSALLMQGPKNWQASNLKVSGDAARVDVRFSKSADENEADFSLSFRLIRSSEGWKFIRFIDLRPKAPEETKEEIAERSAGDDPATTVATYLDLMVAHYNPDKAGQAMSRLSDLAKASDPLWVDTRDARRASGQLQAQFSQMQPSEWALLDTATTEETAEVTVSLRVGNPMMLQNRMMLKMMGGAQPNLVLSSCGMVVAGSWWLSIRKLCKEIDPNETFDCIYCC